MKKINVDLFKDVKLLYVEDDLMTQEEVSYFLKKYVKELYVAKNGEEGLELFLNNKIDMVITDIQMPKMNGLEMSKRILEINPNMPIAITTAYSDADYLIKAIELGIDKYILKPLHLAELLAVIQKGLNLENETNKYYEEYIKFIIDSNPTFLFVLNSERIEFVNKTLLNLFGKEDIKTFSKQLETCKDLFQFENIQTNKNCIEYIIENPNEEYIVSLRNAQCETFSNRKFLVHYKYFESMNKSVFVFNEYNDYKLNKINNIAVDIINNNQTFLDSNILDGLYDIVNLTKKRWHEKFKYKNKINYNFYCNQNSSFSVYSLYFL